jgi:hypothetical protein
MDGAGTVSEQGKLVMARSAERDTLIVVATAAVLHLILFAYDIATQFAPMFQGDRSGLRWVAIEQFRAADFSNLMATLTSSPTVPGEYIFAAAAYAVGGLGAIVAFQILLFLLSLACLCAIAATFPWRHSVLAVGLSYTLLPHNLAFTHQLVTEAIATPFVVFAIYFYFRFMRSRLPTNVLLSGLMLGVAIFVRPPLAPIAPAILAAHVLYRRYFWSGATLGAALLLCVALLPLLAWTAAFTVSTGKLGYTAGVANLSWNLRSKVYLIHERNNLEQPEELRRFQNYGELYLDNTGMSVAEFGEHALEHPLLFAEAAVSDALVFLARGDASKLLVDYFGLGQSEVLKDWRTLWAHKGLSGVVDWVAEDPSVALILSAEVVLSVVTVLCTFAAIVFCGYCLLRPRDVALVIGRDQLSFVLVLTFVLLAVFSGAQLVDQAQGRLRHPAEACLVLLLGFAVLYVTRRYSPSGLAVDEPRDRSRSFA